MNKINNLDQLAKILAKKKVVLCHGVFDLVHFGHISHFLTAKKHGDVLVVSITDDKFVNKGPGRPVFNSNIRAEYLSNIQCVDYVVINNSKTATNVIKSLKPKFYCKGKDYKNHKDDITNEIKNEIKALNSYGGKIIYTDEFSSSSSKLINSYLGVFDNNQKNFLNKFKKYSNKFEQYFKNFKKLKVMVLGETIIDHYFFCEALGKSGKDPILAIKENKNEKYIGGSASIAINLSKFCNKINFVSVVGNEKKSFSFLKSKLPKSIRHDFIIDTERPTIIKKRYIDEISNNKLLSVYNIDDNYMSKNNQKKLLNIVKRNIKKCDLVIVSDYGHGMISESLAKYVCNNSKFLAVNAQINAANRGYHSLLNYKKSDLIIVNENELRHEMRDKQTEIKNLMKKFSLRNNFKDLIITRGNKGVILYNRKYDKFFYSQAFAKKIIDKIGSGDSMLALSSISLALGLEKNLALFFGSLAAAQSVESIGNSTSLDPIKLQKSIYHLVK
ncbi:PfkB family carbohydrate kinase [Candidatus Pelagibacter sp.]|nr:PfkB family carbohydrate kinase [Candidatus Pelagibacter sp.]